jgi:hypothetical protein
MAFAAAITSPLAKAMCCGLGTAGAQEPRRSGAVLSVIRTVPPALMAARLRSRPKGAASSVVRPARRPITVQ